MADLESAVFGRFHPGESFMHALDPRTKLLAVMGLVIAVFGSQTYAGIGLCALLVLAACAASRIPAKVIAKATAPLLIIAALAIVLNVFFTQGGETYVSWGFVTISERGVSAAALAACRLTVLLTGATLLTLTTATLDITEAFERLLSPLAKIGLPAHELGMMMGIALRFLPQFASEARIIHRAQISRGATFGSSVFSGGVSALGALIVPLFTSAFRHAETLALAMDARCYHGGPDRTRLDPLAFARRDAIASALLAATIVCTLALNAVLG